MLSLFLLLFLAAFIFFGILLVKTLKKRSHEDPVCVFFSTMTTIFGLLFFLASGIFYHLVTTVGTESTIDQKIAMYEKQNADIEESIDLTVKNYMEFESSTYIELKDKDAINLVSLFPDLKSDTLVQKQIDLYIANNQKIKELKEAKIDLSKAKWKLYFGK